MKLSEGVVIAFVAVVVAFGFVGVGMFAYYAEIRLDRYAESQPVNVSVLIETERGYTGRSEIKSYRKCSELSEADFRPMFPRGTLYVWCDGERRVYG